MRGGGRERHVVLLSGIPSLALSFLPHPVLPCSRSYWVSSTSTAPTSTRGGGARRTVGVLRLASGGVGASRLTARAQEVHLATVCSLAVRLCHGPSVGTGASRTRAPIRHLRSLRSGQWSAVTSRDIVMARGVLRTVPSTRFVCRSHNRWGMLDSSVELS